MTTITTISRSMIRIIVILNKNETLFRLETFSRQQMFVSISTEMTITLIT